MFSVAVMGREVSEVGKFMRLLDKEFRDGAWHATEAGATRILA